MPIPTFWYNEPWFGYQCCNLLAGLPSRDTVSALAVHWKGNGWGPVYLRAFPTSAQLPACFAAVNDTQILVGISGTDSLSQVWAYTRPDRAGFGPLDSTAINDTFDGWGRLAAELILDFDPSHSREVVLTGHSYGGAVATATARHLIESGYRAPIILVTFGCPKYAGERYLSFLQSIRYVQWINYRDPVPALPPSEGEVGVPLNFKITGIIQLIVPAYQFAGNGLVLHSNGSFKPGGPHFLTPGTFQLSREDVFTVGQQYERFGFHRLGTYRTRLSKWVVPPDRGQAGERHGPLTTPLPAGFPPQPQGLFPEAQKAANFTFQQAQAMALDAVRFEVTALAGGLFSGGQAMPFVPPQFCARKVRVGGQKWQVFWENSMIATGDRTRCLSLVKVLNHFLRRLQVMDGFDVTAFGEVVSVYANEAAAGGLGFKPDTLPLI